MFLIILIAVLIPLRYFEVWKFAEMPWWYVFALMGFAFIWFEYIEKIFGWDKKKKDNNVDEQRRKRRVEESFKKKK